MPVLANPYRFSVQEYHRLAETGVLSPEARVELLDGIITNMFPIGPFHSGSVGRFIEVFAALGQGRWQINAQNPVRLSNRSEPQPDFVLLKPRADYYTVEHPQADDVILLVEIADSSLRYDREEKLAFYAKGGIKEFWLVNLPERLIEVYRQPASDGSYGFNHQVRPSEQVALEAFPDTVIAVSDLLIAPRRGA